MWSLYRRNREREELRGGGRGVTLHSSPGLSKYPRSLHGSARRSKRLSAICIVLKDGGAFRSLTVHRQFVGNYDNDGFFP